MTYHAPFPHATESEGVFHRQERRLGRAGWAKAQYLAAGRAEFDARYTASTPPNTLDREHYAQCFWEINAPPRPRPYPPQDGGSW